MKTRFPEGARPEGLEPSTYGLEIRCSVQLSYGRKCKESEEQNWPNRRTVNLLLQEQVPELLSLSCELSLLRRPVPKSKSFVDAARGKTIGDRNQFCRAGCGLHVAQLRTEF
jgi:hypothetical protein